MQVSNSITGERGEMGYCCGGWRMLQMHRNHKKLVYGVDTALVMLPLSLSFSPFRPLSSSSSSLPFSFNTHLSSSSSSISQVTAEQDQQQQNSHRKSSQLVALEYAELNLSNNLDMGHVRIRQHVNPLSSSFSTTAKVPDWNQVFADPALPLMVDIGCGSGRFLMWLAKRTPKVRNYLGLEIRQRMVKRAEAWVKDLALDNIHFLFANAPISFKQLVESYPGPLQLVSILCPDPHFKRKHHKRRVLHKPLVGAIVDNLSPGGQVFVQSDVVEVALDMKNQLDEVDALSHIDALNSDILCDSEGWLLSNPMGIRTEREIHAEFEGAKIYRRLYEKKQM